MEPTEVITVKTTSKRALLIGVTLGFAAAVGAFVLKERLLDHVVETVENSHSASA